MTEFSLRSGTPADAPELLKYEQRYFPAVAGQPHAGYLYTNDELASLTLTEELAAQHRSFTIVAEIEGRIVGFASAVPFSLPGTGQFDPAHMLLQYLAVDPAHRRNGIATALVGDIERRALAARQNVIVAHIPADEFAFYESLEWHVAAEDNGFAWLPFARHLLADLGDVALGFPLMAAKVLRPRAVRRSFDFAIVSGRPTFDAATELMRIVDAGEIDTNDLDADTREMVAMARRGPVPQAVLDLFGSAAGRPWALGRPA
jgi:predicted N-acetyltransferase YhbS